MNEQVRKIEEYVFARYVDFAEHGSVDEDAARKFLEEWYLRPENASDPECCYLGILYFERGFEDATNKVEFLRRAKFWLERSRALSHESWDAVDERLADIDSFFKSAGIEVAATAPPPKAAAPAAGVAHPAEIEDHGPMVFVPGGEFLFGETREVRVLPAFYVDKYPVTNRQYEAFCRDTGYRWPKYWTDPRFNGQDHPVVGISAADALKYCRWAGKDLPTEEQWEKAARGTDGRLYPWGDDEPMNGRACSGRDPTEGTTDPVSAHPENRSPFGAMDLAGNVWEWTSTTIEDGETYHVVKGGCFNDPPTLLRADVRLEAGPKDKFETIGFRCVKVV